MLSRIDGVIRFKDESIGAIREGSLGEERPKENEILYEARINGRVVSGIRVFHKLAKHISIFKLKADDLFDELEENWVRVKAFLEGRTSVELPYYRPSVLSLIYGKPELEINYSSVITVWGTFTFVELPAPDATSYGFPVRDLIGKDFEVAATLFVPPLHSFLSLKVLNLI